MKYRIKYLKELRFEFSNHDHEKIRNSNIILNTSFKENYDVEAKELSIFLHCVYGIRKEDTGKQILHSDIIIGFEFDSIPKSKKKRNQLLVDLFPSLLGITISSMRGIIYSRTKGEPINDYILPVMNPTKMIEERVSKKPLQITGV